MVLSEAARNAFYQLNKAVISALVLAYPYPNKEYLLKTDASKLGLGAVLSQKLSQWGLPSCCLQDQGNTWCRGQLPQYKTRVFGGEVVY